MHAEPAVPDIPAGCYACVSTRSLFGWLIRMALHCPYDHAFVCLGGGQIAEATFRGVHKSSISEYAGRPAVANTGEMLTHSQRAVITAKAKSFLGDEYGWGDIAVIALRLLGFRWGWLQRVADDKDALICSELACKAGLAAGLESWQCGEPDPAFVTPADLAAREGVEPVGL